MPDTRYRRNLPHIHPDGYPLFITFRLADSLPMEIILKIREQCDGELKTASKKIGICNIDERYFERFDDWLDRCGSGPRWLEKEEIAAIVANKISEMDHIRYELFAYCIMPNHVHLLFESYQVRSQHKGKSAKYTVTETMRLLKGSTARDCKLVLGRNGHFWQHESYDHIVRDEEELVRTIQYILNNPVKAGWVEDWKDWKFTYVNPELGKW